MSHLLDERRISISELAARERVNTSTAWRWCLRGCRGVKLESFAIGGRRYSTIEAFGRFVERTNAATVGHPVTSRTNRQRNAAISQAERALDDAGIR